MSLRLTRDLFNSAEVVQGSGQIKNTLQITVNTDGSVTDSSGNILDILPYGNRGDHCVTKLEFTLPEALQEGYECFIVADLKEGLYVQHCSMESLKAIAWITTSMSFSETDLVNTLFACVESEALQTGNLDGEIEIFVTDEFSGQVKSNFLTSGWHTGTVDDEYIMTGDDTVVDNHVPETPNPESYTPMTWVNGETELNAANMNNIMLGINENKEVTKNLENAYIDIPQDIQTWIDSHFDENNCEVHLEQNELNNYHWNYFNQLCYAITGYQSTDVPISSVHDFDHFYDISDMVRLDTDEGYIVLEYEDDNGESIHITFNHGNEGYTRDNKFYRYYYEDGEGYYEHDGVVFYPFDNHTVSFTGYQPYWSQIKEAFTNDLLSNKGYKILGLKADLQSQIDKKADLVGALPIFTKSYSYVSDFIRENNLNNVPFIYKDSTNCTTLCNFRKMGGTIFDYEMLTIQSFNNKILHTHKTVDLSNVRMNEVSVNDEVLAVTRDFGDTLFTPDSNFTVNMQHSYKIGDLIFVHINLHRNSSVSSTGIYKIGELSITAQHQHLFMGACYNGSAANSDAAILETNGDLKLRLTGTTSASTYNWDLSFFFAENN